MEMRPSTIVALIVLVLLIFVPAFFVDVEKVANDTPDANGREAPPPPTRTAAPANTPKANLAPIVPPPSNGPIVPRANGVVE